MQATAFYSSLGMHLNRRTAVSNTAGEAACTCLLRHEAPLRVVCLAVAAVLAAVDVLHLQGRCESSASTEVELPLVAPESWRLPGLSTRCPWQLFSSALVRPYAPATENKARRGAARGASATRVLCMHSRRCAWQGQGPRWGRSTCRWRLKWRGRQHASPLGRLQGAAGLGGCNMHPPLPPLGL